MPDVVRRGQRRRGLAARSGTFLAFVVGDIALPDLPTRGYIDVPELPPSSAVVCLATMAWSFAEPSSSERADYVSVSRGGGRVRGRPVLGYLRYAVVDAFVFEEPPAVARSQSITA